MENASGERVSALARHLKVAADHASSLKNVATQVCSGSQMFEFNGTDTLIVSGKTCFGCALRNVFFPFFLHTWLAPESKSFFLFWLCCCWWCCSGDIGGTNSRFQLWTSPERNHAHDNTSSSGRLSIPGELLFNQQYPNEQYEKFADVLQQFFDEANAACVNTSGHEGILVDVICVAVAG